MAKRKTDINGKQLMFEEPELGLHPVAVPRKRKPSASPVMERLLDAAVEMRQNPDAAEIAFMVRQLVQCTLPHKNPGNVPIWIRTNGNLKLKIRPYIDDAGQALYPYGVIPRLLMFWIVTEVTRTQSRHIKLGSSLDSFIKAVGLNPRTGGGKRGDAKRLHLQMERLFRAVISFENEGDDHKRWVDMQVAPDGELWWDTKRTTQDTLWDSWIEIGERFHQAIIAAPVPVDLRALRGLKRSPLALDLYALLTYTAFSASRKGQTRTIPWNGLHAQMGGDYAELWHFRPKVISALRKIRLVYPALKVESTEDGLVVRPSKAAIPPTR
jgi:hypothetical protein